MKTKTEYEKLEAGLEAKFPTPQSITDLIAEEKKISDKMMQLLDIEYRTAEQEEEYDILQTNSIEICNSLMPTAVKENHLLTLVRMNIFLHDLTEQELNQLTGIKDFSDQLDKSENKLYDGAFIETLIANGIDTAQRFSDLIDSYFATQEMQDVNNYKPLDESLEKFIGMELTEDLTLDVEWTLTDEDTGEAATNEDTGEVVKFTMNQFILPKGIVDERALKNTTHDEIMSALQAKLDAVVAAEDYVQARKLQTQIDKLK